MTRPRGSLRRRMAVLGFAAIYVPVLLLLGVVVATEDEALTTVDGVEVAAHASTGASSWVTLTTVVLGPVAAALAWWWAGRAVRPLRRIRAVAEEVQAAESGRRIGLTEGPQEVTSLAASFDAMLDRLQHAAEVQRELVEELSHDLRTPVAVVLASADVALTDPHPTIESYRQSLERCRSGAGRLQSTIDELVAGARRRARTIDRRPEDLTLVAREVVDQAAALGRAADVDVVFTGPPAAACAIDAPSVRRAITNLVDNAIRVAPPGTAVSVDVALTDDLATVTVADHGPGIAEPDQALVFGRFWQDPDGAGGTGLGLAIAKQVALAHGGDLTLVSPGPTGDGCVFRLTLRR